MAQSGSLINSDTSNFPKKIFRTPLQTTSASETRSAHLIIYLRPFSPGTTGCRVEQFERNEILINEIPSATHTFRFYSNTANFVAGMRANRLFLEASCFIKPDAEQSYEDLIDG